MSDYEDDTLNYDDLDNSGSVAGYEDVSEEEIYLPKEPATGDNVATTTVEIPDIPEDILKEFNERKTLLTEEELQQLRNRIPASRAGPTRAIGSYNPSYKSSGNNVVKKIIDKSGQVPDIMYQKTDKQITEKYLQKDAAIRAAREANMYPFIIGSTVRVLRGRNRNITGIVTATEGDQCVIQYSTGLPLITNKETGEVIEDNRVAEIRVNCNDVFITQGVRKVVITSNVNIPGLGMANTRGLVGIVKGVLSDVCDVFVQALGKNIRVPCNLLEILDEPIDNIDDLTEGIQQMNIVDNRPRKLPKQTVRLAASKVGEFPVLPKLNKGGNSRGWNVESVQSRPNDIPENIRIRGVVQPRIIDYNTEYIAVIGNTFPLNNDFQELGSGMYSFAIKVDGVLESGWLFPKNDEPTVRELIELVGPVQEPSGVRVPQKAGDYEYEKYFGLGANGKVPTIDQILVVLKSIYALDANSDAIRYIKEISNYYGQKYGMNSAEYLNIIARLAIFLNPNHPVGKYAEYFRTQVLNGIYKPENIDSNIEIFNMIPELYYNKNVSIDDKVAITADIESLLDNDIRQIKHELVSITDPTAQRKPFPRTFTTNQLPSIDTIDITEVCENPYWYMKKANIIIVREDGKFYCLDLINLLGQIAAGAPVVNIHTGKLVDESIVTRLKERYSAELASGNFSNLSSRTVEEVGALQRTLDGLVEFKRVLNKYREVVATFDLGAWVVLKNKSIESIPGSIIQKFDSFIAEDEAKGDKELNGAIAKMNQWLDTNIATIKGIIDGINTKEAQKVVVPVGRSVVVRDIPMPSRGSVGMRAGVAGYSSEAPADNFLQRTVYREGSQVQRDLPSRQVPMIQQELKNIRKANPKYDEQVDDFIYKEVKPVKMTDAAKEKARIKALADLEKGELKLLGDPYYLAKTHKFKLTANPEEEVAAEAAGFAREVVAEGEVEEYATEAEKAEAQKIKAEQEQDYYKSYAEQRAITRQEIMEKARKKAEQARIAAENAAAEKAAQGGVSKRKARMEPELIKREILIPGTITNNVVERYIKRLMDLQKNISDQLKVASDPQLRSVLNEKLIQTGDLLADLRAKVESVDGILQLLGDTLSDYQQKLANLKIPTGIDMAYSTSEASNYEEEGKLQKSIKDLSDEINFITAF